jgi:hypothetical protein
MVPGPAPNLPAYFKKYSGEIMPVSRKRKTRPKVLTAKPQTGFGATAAKLRENLRVRYRARPRFYQSLGGAVVLSATILGVGWQMPRAAHRLCVVPDASVIPVADIYSLAGMTGMGESGRIFSNEFMIEKLNLELTQVLEKDSGAVIDSRKQVVGQMVAGFFFRDGELVFPHPQFNGEIKMTIQGTKITVRNSDRFVLSPDHKAVQLGAHRFPFSRLADRVATSNGAYVAAVPAGRVKIHSAAMAHRCE